MIAIYLTSNLNRIQFSNLLKSNVFAFNYIYTKQQLNCKSYSLLFTDIDEPFEDFPIEKQIHLGKNEDFTRCVTTIEELLEYIGDTSKPIDLKELEVRNIVANDFFNEVEEVESEITGDTVSSLIEPIIESDEQSIKDNSQASSTESVVEVHQIENKPGVLLQNIEENKIFEEINLPIIAQSDEIRPPSSVTLSEIQNTQLSKVPLRTPMVAPPAFETPTPGRFHVGVKRTVRKSIFLIYGASARCGSSSVAYSLACELAKDLGRKVLLVDLDLLKPDLTQYIFSNNHISMADDARISSMFRLPFDKYLQYLPLVTKTIVTQQTNLRFIGGPLDPDFTHIGLMCGYNYNPAFAELSKVYDTIIVDMGKYDANLNYQSAMINDFYVVSLFVYSAKNDETLRVGMENTLTTPVVTKCILNECSQTTNKYMVSKILGRPVIGTVLYRAALKNKDSEFDMVKLEEPVFKTNWETLVSDIVR